MGGERAGGGGLGLRNGDAARLGDTLVLLLLLFVLWLLPLLLPLVVPARCGVECLPCEAVAAGFIFHAAMRSATAAFSVSAPTS